MASGKASAPLAAPGMVADLDGNDSFVGEKLRRRSGSEDGVAGGEAAAPWRGSKDGSEVGSGS
jgi:hypothetical protein